MLRVEPLPRAGKAIKTGLARYFDKNGQVLGRTLDQVEEFDGYYSCIFSTQPLPKDQLVRLYFDKDLVEKAFRALKGVVKLQPIRHWLSQRVIAHVFICYLAYLLLALLKYRLKPTGISPEEALDELSTMYKVYLQDSKQVHRLSRVVTLTRRQETVLKAINPALLKAQN